jgi:hypothetical protein
MVRLAQTAIPLRERFLRRLRDCSTTPPAGRRPETGLRASLSSPGRWSVSGDRVRFRACPIICGGSVRCTNGVGETQGGLSLRCQGRGATGEYAPIGKKR